MIRISTARTAAELDSLRGLWEMLYSQCGDATLFQSYAWNRLATEHFASREQPHVIAAESDSGAALIPAAITGTGLVLLGETLFDYRDVLAIGDPVVLQAAWAKMAELRLPLEVTGVRGAARNRWENFAPKPFAAAPQVLCAEISAAEFARQHSRLGRTLRRLAHQGVELRQYDGRASGLLAWTYSQKAMQIGSKPNNLFRDPSRIDFMVAACALAPAQCEIFVFEQQDRPIATLVTFLERVESAPVRRFYTIQFDPAWAALSPGTALLYEVTRRSLDASVDCDYMTGEQPHKQRFMTSSVPLFRVQAPAETLLRAAGRPAQTEEAPSAPPGFGLAA